MLRAPIFGAKNNFAATVDPTVNDDVTIGYAVGSEWLRTDTTELFVCFDNSAGAAVWQEVGVGGGGGTHVDTVDPTVNDDTTQGFDVGDLWLNTTTEKLWQCLDASTGAAVWWPVTSVQTQIIYVGKHGNDSYDGKSVERAKLTFGAAITAAGTPADEANAVTVKCADNGVYTEDIDTPIWVSIHAPGAAIDTVAVEGHRIRDYCRWDIGSITCNERAVFKSHSDSAWSVFRCRRIERTGTNNQPIRCAAGRLIIDVDLITGTGGAVACIADADGVDAEVYGRIGRAESLSAASSGINCMATSTGNAYCSLRIDSVFYATGLSGTFAMAATTGAGVARLNLSFGSIVGDTLTALATFTSGGGARILSAVGGHLQVTTPVQTFSAGDEVTLICNKIDGGTNSLTDGSKVRITEAMRNNFTAVTDPTVNDDSADGYTVGSEWLNTVTKHLWICVDDTATAAVWEAIKTQDTLAFTFINNGAVLNTGVQDAAYLEVPFDLEIVAVRMYGAPSGDIQVDLWNDTYANYPPTIADTIVASAPPKIVSGVKSEDVTLTGWTKTLVAGSGILPNIDSVTNISWAKLVLVVERR